MRDVTDVFVLHKKHKPKDTDAETRNIFDVWWLVRESLSSIFESVYFDVPQIFGSVPEKLTPAIVQEYKGTSINIVLNIVLVPNDLMM